MKRQNKPVFLFPGQPFHSSLIYLGLLVNFRLGWKGLPEASTPACLPKSYMTKKKAIFVTGKPFQPILISYLESL
jgi:hypothetical protein